ncbi:hypothetical protein PNEG_03184 [Pneumocystis murina B123]|uniref:Uncharacterized protein n=1 Tax=Pneumocystis murina (strain B123) TaxID=1069680 RepID=M7PD16_PNEMU|nr:hypothetical protein PNEG_03184 [Pneumocystis murina B123]EMR08344.1 hypothetical protein PNEG_03184 [Pneumocystis murina B123]
MLLTSLRYFFGGAITADLPQDFIDASQFREIPDHQEVLVNINDERSIMIELLEFAPVDDIDVSKFHFDLLAQDNEAEESLILNVSCVTLEKSGYTVYLLEGLQKIFKYNKQSADYVNKEVVNPLLVPYVAIFLSVLRLHEKSTDIIISINIPFLEIQYLSSFFKDSSFKISELVSSSDLNHLNILKNIFDMQEVQFSTRETLLNILNTLQIHDWSLFVNN